MVWVKALIHPTLVTKIIGLVTIPLGILTELDIYNNNNNKQFIVKSDKQLWYCDRITPHHLPKDNYSSLTRINGLHM